MNSRNLSPFRYLRFLTRDVLRGPGVIYGLITVLLLAMFWRIKSTTNFDLDTATLQTQIFDTVILVAVLLATGGMVSGDVHNGYYRSWFSKPMAPWWFYLQRWLLGALLLMCMPFVLGAGLAIILGDGMGVTATLIGHIAIGYLLIGGAVFLLSTVVRKDWLIVFILAFVQTGLVSLSEVGVNLPGLVDIVARALPPFHLLSTSGPLPSGFELLHLLTYGGGMAALAVTILVLRPLGRGGRA